MNIKAISKRALSLISAAVMTAAAAVTVYAAATDYDIEITTANTVSSWENIPVSMDHYDASKFTEQTEVIVTYSYTTDVPEECPIELIVQSWSNPDTPMVNASGGVWAKVEPASWDDTTAVFSYADMVAAYGTSDLSGVDSINVGATASSTITVTNLRFTNCGKDFYVSMTDAERAEMYKNMLIAVLASALAIIVIIIVVFMIMLKRKTDYAYDAATGTYVKMDKSKKQN